VTFLELPLWLFGGLFGFWIFTEIVDMIRDWLKSDPYTKYMQGP
jgi:hypothetical protein